ncbi:subtilisin-like protein [Amniculicola lignicola CBS 123094]|uniref:Subtilisin-like protein n=1 Tax=Amniculicola lignicola CBS 123094 TaxID=1392246 RepID=A0A6A5WIK5_9PLEO|nr:subtilisin-like protein [Amniculicola lignicola CBS 123094]
MHFFRSFVWLGLLQNIRCALIPKPVDTCQTYSVIPKSPDNTASTDNIESLLIDFLGEEQVSASTSPSGGPVWIVNIEPGLDFPLVNWAHDAIPDAELVRIPEEEIVETKRRFARQPPSSMKNKPRDDPEPDPDAPMDDGPPPKDGLGPRPTTPPKIVYWTAAAKDPKNKDGNKNAEDAISAKLKDPKKMIVIKDFKDDNQLLGWGNLELDDTAKAELEKNEFISKIVKDEKVLNSGRSKHQLDKRIPRAWHAMYTNDVLAHLSQYPTNRPPPGNLALDTNWYVYNSHEGLRTDLRGVYIYVVDEGVTVDAEAEAENEQVLGEEFPANRREATIYTNTIIAQGRARETDDNDDSHGTNMASLALGAFYGVSKLARLVSIKTSDTLADNNEGLRLAWEHIRNNNRQDRSIILNPAGHANPTGRNVLNPNHREYDPDAFYCRQVLDALFDLGVPVIVGAGNDRRNRRDVVDFWPANWAQGDFPLLVAGEVDYERHRSQISQGGHRVTTWVFSERAQTINRDGTFEVTWGTSAAAAILAGQMAAWDALDDDMRPWGRRQGRDRVNEMRRFLRTDGRSGWIFDHPDNRDKRVLWNGATLQDHREAIPPPVPMATVGPPHTDGGPRPTVGGPQPTNGGPQPTGPASPPPAGGDDDCQQLDSGTDNCLPDMDPPGPGPETELNFDPGFDLPGPI